MRQQSVHLYVFDSMADWEAGYAVAGINQRAFQKNPERYRIETVAARSGPVTTMGGITILPDMTLSALSPTQSGMLILPGGTTWEDGRHGEVLAAARQFLEAGVPVAAICAATAALAQAGILDSRRHTSNAREYLLVTGYAGARLYADRPAVSDGDVITAAGTAPVDFAYEIFRRLDLYQPEALEAWYGLFKTADPTYYAGLAEAADSAA
jgi:putative intracellular protease/amidase